MPAPPRRRTRAAARETLRRVPTQDRSAARVQAILAAAAELFASGGLHGVSTHAIAGKAGVPIGTLYQFFPDKLAILRALVDDYRSRLRELVAALPVAEVDALPLDEAVDVLLGPFEAFRAGAPDLVRVMTMLADPDGPRCGIPELREDLIDAVAAVISRVFALAPALARVRAIVVVDATDALFLTMDLLEPRSRRGALRSELRRLIVAYLSDLDRRDGRTT